MVGGWQALVHLVLDVGELGATLGILWGCLRAYRPRALGWFHARLWPPHPWLGHMVLACAAFPLVDLAAARSQVGNSPQTKRECRHATRSEPRVR